MGCFGFRMHSAKQEFLGDEEVSQGGDEQGHRRVLQQDTDAGQVVAGAAEAAQLTVFQVRHLVYGWWPATQLRRNARPDG